jgi:hypothetical protein
VSRFNDAPLTSGAQWAMAMYDSSLLHVRIGGNMFWGCVYTSSVGECERGGGGGISHRPLSAPSQRSLSGDAIRN